jgi:hypothetical protein
MRLRFDWDYDRYTKPLRIQHVSMLHVTEGAPAALSTLQQRGEGLRMQAKLLD